MTSLHCCKAQDDALRKQKPRAAPAMRSWAMKYRNSRQAIPSSLQLSPGEKASSNAFCRLQCKHFVGLPLFVRRLTSVTKTPYWLSRAACGKRHISFDNNPTRSVSCSPCVARTSFFASSPASNFSLSADEFAVS